MATNSLPLPIARLLALEHEAQALGEKHAKSGRPLTDDEKFAIENMKVFKKSIILVIFKSHKEVETLLKGVAGSGKIRDDELTVAHGCNENVGLKCDAPRSTSSARRSTRVAPNRRS